LLDGLRISTAIPGTFEGIFLIMYLRFYNLKKQPFHITPDREFLYLSPSHKEALAAIIYGIEEKKGFLAILGAVGVGKTTILRSYLEGAERKHLKIIYIFSSRLTFEGLLRTVFQELGLSVDTTDIMEMVNRLYEVLIEEYKKGNTVVLIVDEAQNMPVDTLEDLRMISNLETSTDKLIQIVLAGQPEFEDQLNLDRLRQLKQRLAIRATIRPLTKKESLDYIKFRLRKAGSEVGPVFTPSALSEIVDKAKGVPRIINILCDNALIAGLGYSRKPVTKKIAKEIIRDFAGSARPRSRMWIRAVAAFGALLLLTGATWFLPNKEKLLNRLGVSSQRTHVLPDRATSEARPVERAVERPATKDEQGPPLKEREQQAAFTKKVGSAVVTKTVHRGDTLSGLMKDVYGVDEKNLEAGKLLDLVRLNNPQIKNVNIIVPGQKIAFPESKTPSSGLDAGQGTSVGTRD
jgi:general secretion pathway protein A